MTGGDGDGVVESKEGCGVGDRPVRSGHCDVCLGLGYVFENQTRGCARALQPVWSRFSSGTPPCAQLSTAAVVC